jgi:SEC22 vesicle trafficking protein A/C
MACSIMSLSMGLSFVTLCEEHYPTVLAFCFLEELQREFLGTCDYQKVLDAKRAYTFIEFGITRFILL